MLDVLDDFGFIEPVHGRKIDKSTNDNAIIENELPPRITLNKNFYPEEKNQ